MPFTSASDISIVLSGGTVNIDPSASLGGDPSSTPISSGVINNLFADVSSDQSKVGLEDYRCVYIFNDGQTPIYNVRLWIGQILVGSSQVEIGIDALDETQRITISGVPVTGGSFTLSYKGTNFTSAYNADLGTWATQLQNAILALADQNGNKYFNSVVVTGQNAGTGTVIFNIGFTGLDGSRNFDAFTVVSNGLLPASQVNLFVTTPQIGTPINTIAPEIGVETTPPGGVGFYAAGVQSPIVLPVLKPTEGFPLWVKRVIPAGVEAAANDGFVLNFKADSLAP